MCVLSPVLHTSNISSCQRKKTFSCFSVAVKNSIKVGPLVFLLYMFVLVIMENSLKRPILPYQICSIFPFTETDFKWSENSNGFFKRVSFYVNSICIISLYLRMGLAIKNSQSSQNSQNWFLDQLNIFFDHIEKFAYIRVWETQFAGAHYGGFHKFYATAYVHIHQPKLPTSKQVE